MAINMYIGYKKPNGAVSAIYARVDGGEDQDKLLYKYYRTPERVSALIKSGSTKSALGIYISKTEEINTRSALYNEEVMKLPLYVGSAGEDSMISFAEDNFYEHKDGNSEEIYDYGSVEDFYADAKKVDFGEDYVYLFDSKSCEWTVGYNGKTLKEVIIENFDENSEYNYDSSEKIEHDKKILIDNIDRIDQFIADRAKIGPCFIDSNNGNPINIPDGKLLIKYHDLYMYAKALGINFEGIIVSFADEISVTDGKKRWDSFIKVYLTSD